MAERKKRKQQVARKPEEVEDHKKRFLVELELGNAPGTAARKAHIARCTAYKWKKEDPEFDAAWHDAIETSLDDVESGLFDRAKKGNSADAQFIMKHRRRETYGNTDGPNKQNFILNITLQDHYKRLEQLGLPIPVREGDYEEEHDARAIADHS